MASPIELLKTGYPCIDEKRKVPLSNNMALSILRCDKNNTGAAVAMVKAGELILLAMMVHGIQVAWAVRSNGMG